MDLQQWLKDRGLNFEPILDNKVHRCDENGTKKEDHIWYKGSENLFPGGKTWVSLTIGNWKTGEKEYFPEKNGRVWSDDERTFHEKKWKEASEQEEREKASAQEAAAQEAQKMWDAATVCEGDHEYLRKKQISEVARLVRAHNGAIVIPMQDISGKLWGTQRIWPGGQKLFLKGQRKLDTFFQFGSGTPDIAYIAEGFATTASIFKAVGANVFVSFDAGNLKSVSLGVRRLYPDSKIIICGDDDRWNESGKNVGREKAQEAAQAVGGIAVFPYIQISNYTHKPTDWNDLHCLEGLDEVRRQIHESTQCVGGDIRQAKKDEPEGESPARQKTNRGIQSDVRHHDNGPKSTKSGGEEPEQKEEDDKSYINFLGHAGDCYFYTSNSNKQIVTIPRSSHSDLALCDLMPFDYWASRFIKNGPKGQISVNWKEAAYEMMSRCRAAGIFNTEKIRGSGCWIDSGKLVIHLGDRIIVDKMNYMIGEFPSKFIYELGKGLPAPVDEGLTTDEGMTLVGAVSCLKWKHQDDIMYFLGWLVISRICGALSWRPHIWLTGPSGSGKSTVIEMIVKKILGDWGVTPVGASSEAGIRQGIGKDARPVIFDEAETSNRKSSAKIQSILELIRQASSNTDSKIMKGTADQGGLQFKINSIFMLSSIRVNLSEEADKNRFTICELLRNDPKDWGFIQDRINLVDESYGDKIFRKALNYFPVLQKNKEIFANEIAKIHNQRIGQQYGTLLAGYQLLLSCEEIGQVDAADIVRSLHIADKEVLEIEEDESECVNHLLACRVRVVDVDGIGMEIMMGHLIDRCIQEVPAGVYHYRNQLGLYGLKLSKDGMFLRIASTNPELKKLYSDTKWQNNLWTRALRRIADATPTKIKLAGSSVWATQVPMSSVISS